LGTRRESVHRRAARHVFAAIAALTLTNCALSMTHHYAGQPVADVVRDLGSPANIFDAKIGVRQFEWSTSDVVVTSAPEGGYSEIYWNENLPLDLGAPRRGSRTLMIVARWRTRGRRGLSPRQSNHLERATAAAK
jgi:hypothetical protein